MGRNDLGVSASMNVAAYLRGKRKPITSLFNISSRTPAATTLTKLYKRLLMASLRSQHLFLQPEGGGASSVS
jgi:hypothetical protein